MADSDREVGRDTGNLCLSGFFYFFRKYVVNHADRYLLIEKNCIIVYNYARIQEYTAKLTEEESNGRQKSIFK